jgi:hypothetical protein
VAYINSGLCVFLKVSESGVLLKDVDGDGLEDILIAITRLDQYEDFHRHLPESNFSFKTACKKIGMLLLLSPKQIHLQ